MRSTVWVLIVFSFFSCQDECLVLHSVQARAGGWPMEEGFRQPWRGEKTISDLVKCLVPDISIFDIRYPVFDVVTRGNRMSGRKKLQRIRSSSTEELFRIWVINISDVQYTIYILHSTYDIQSRNEGCSIFGLKLFLPYRAPQPRRYSLSRDHSLLLEYTLLYFSRPYFWVFVVDPLDNSCYAVDFFVIFALSSCFFFSRRRRYEACYDRWEVLRYTAIWRCDRWEVLWYIPHYGDTIDERY